MIKRDRAGEVEILVNDAGQGGLVEMDSPTIFIHYGIYRTRTSEKKWLVPRAQCEKGGFEVSCGASIEFFFFLSCHNFVHDVFLSQSPRCVSLQVKDLALFFAKYAGRVERLAAGSKRCLVCWLQWGVPCELHKNDNVPEFRRREREGDAEVESLVGVWDLPELAQRVYLKEWAAPQASQDEVEE